MKPYLFCLLTFSFLLLAGCRPAAAPVAVGDQPVSINDRPTTNLPLPPSKPLSDMSWTDPDSRVHKLADLKGKAVILDFWATYCGPCREEIPHLNQLLTKHGSDNLTIVGLNVGGKEDMDKVPDFTKTTKIDYPIALPEDELTRFIFAGRTEIPQTAVFDRRGNLVKKFMGYNATIKKELDDAVAAAVSAN